MNLWLSQHPGYQKKYRATHPEYRQKNRERERQRRAARRGEGAAVDIQVQSWQKTSMIKKEIRSLKGMGKQVQFNGKTIEILEDFLRLSACIYKCSYRKKP